MPYPDEFEGFMITELGKYKDFKRQSVSHLMDSYEQFLKLRL